jgi:hypothetical protein
MESTIGNSTHSQGRVSSYLDTFVQAACLVLRIEFKGKNPALRLGSNFFGCYITKKQPENKLFQSK